MAERGIELRGVVPQFGISRKTRYKLVDRFRYFGWEGLGLWNRATDYSAYMEAADALYVWSCSGDALRATSTTAIADPPSAAASGRQSASSVGSE